MPDVFVPIIVASVGVIGSLTTVALKYYLDNKKKIKADKEKHRFVNIIPAMSELYTILQEVIVNSEADRVMILKTENNGGRPRFGCQLFSSVLYEIITSNLESKKNSWQRRPLDQEYTELLTNMMSHSELYYEFVLNDLMDASLLKDIYERDGVNRSVIQVLAEREKTLVYIALNWKSDKMLSATQREAIRTGVLKLQNLLSEYKEI